MPLWSSWCVRPPPAARCRRSARSIRISARLVDANGGQALPGKGRDRSGVCGSAIRGAGLDMVSRLAAIRERLGLDYAIIGVGGVVAPEDYRAYRAAGADAVMSATGAMWDAELARKIKADD